LAVKENQKKVSENRIWLSDSPTPPETTPREYSPEAVHEPVDCISRLSSENLDQVITSEITGLSGGEGRGQVNAESSESTAGRAWRGVAQVEQRDSQTSWCHQRKLWPNLEC
jgi:hypothetical protein